MPKYILTLQLFLIDSLKYTNLTIPTVKLCIDNNIYKKIQA